MYILRVMVFIAVVLSAFGYVANQIPQEVSVPPVEEKFDATKVKTVADVSEIGQKIFFGKGQCALCHALGKGTEGRCPNLEGIGRKLARAFEYETYTNPSAYIYLDYTSSPPESFPAVMPQINKPPIGLTEPEMLSVFAFLQGQSGQIEITPEEIIALGAPKAETAAMEVHPTGDAEAGKLVYEQQICSECHTIGAEGMVTEDGMKKAGPDLLAVAREKNASDVRRGLFEKGEAHKAYDELMTVRQTNDLVAYIMGLRQAPSPEAASEPVAAPEATEAAGEAPTEPAAEGTQL